MFINSFGEFHEHVLTMLFLVKTPLTGGKINLFESLNETITCLLCALSSDKMLLQYLLRSSRPVIFNVTTGALHPVSLLLSAASQFYQAMLIQQQQQHYRIIITTMTYIIIIIPYNIFRKGFRNHIFD